jgi:succinylglutamate desuccinylase
LPVLVMGIQMDFKADRDPFYRYIEQRLQRWFDGRGHAAENERQFRDSPRMQKDQMQ